ncbi:hypothetical protein L6R52_43205 [Myxococcota bacterium]|nr:hypothetical protein [Myxococcota bacterium]
MRALLVLLASVAPSTVLAEGAQIGVWPEAARAPATLVLTASVSTGDAVVAYDWGLLPAAPRCRSAACPLSMPVAACERVDVRATTELGEALTATVAACARDALGAPPRAELVISESDGGFLVEPSWALGDAPVAITRLWIDDGEVLEPARPAGFAVDGGCHAVDLLVVDVDGRFGLDRRRVCGHADAPRAWLGADGAPYAPITDGLAVCLEVDHPLGLAVEVVSGAVTNEGCAPRVAAPPGLERRVAIVRDAAGATSFASLFVAGIAPDAPPTLFFASLPAFASGIAGRPMELSIALVGGQGPFVVEAVVTDAAGGAPTPISARVPSGPTAKVSFTPIGLISSGRVDVVVTDVHGREARATGELAVYPGSVGPEVPGAAACTASGGPGGGAALVAIALVGLWVRRRA